MDWQPDWEELDLVLGVAVSRGGSPSLLEPAAFGTVVRNGIQLPDVSVLGSDQGDRFFIGVGSRVDGGAGSDALFNTESQGENLLLGGLGADQFFLRRVNDRIIGGSQWSDATGGSLSTAQALADGERDRFLIDRDGSSSVGGSLEILDYEPGLDTLLLDGEPLGGDWQAMRLQLQSLGVAVNAAPQAGAEPIRLDIQPGQAGAMDLSTIALDADGDSLVLLKQRGPGWITIDRATLLWTAPADLNEESLAGADLVLGFSDGRAVTEVVPILRLVSEPPPAAPSLSISAQVAEIAEGDTGTTLYSFVVNRQGDRQGVSSSGWSVRGSGSNPADASDFLAGQWPSGTVSFAAGETEQTISIPIAADRVQEADEAFTVSLESPDGAVLEGQRSTAVGLIHNDDNAPPAPPPAAPATLSIVADTTAAAEGRSGSVRVSFTIRRSGALEESSEVDWVLRGDGPNPADAEDFTAGLLSGTLRFAPGSTSQTLRVDLASDRQQEAEEGFAVELLNARGALIGTGTAPSLIRNDDQIGGGGRNRLTGTDLADFLDGRGGRDRLTGGGGADVFGFRLGDSGIRTPDRITDFRFGEDRIDLFRSNGRDLAGPKRFLRAADNSKARNLSELARAIGADADGRAPGKQRLKANSATLIRATRPEIKGTYLLINDSNPGLDLDRDLMVNISGFNGRLPRLGSLPVDSVFA
ncbi:MAG: Calx-beta domain-containing protein [Synechococcaceae cyanobacterium]|jgi:hypothetical protein